MSDKYRLYLRKKVWRRLRLLLLPLFVTHHLLLLTACMEVQEHTAQAIYERDSVSVMTSYGVNTLISDSGVIKYKIVTERWDVNTIRQPTRWTFEKGVFFEQFDEKFKTEGYIQADTAWYYDQIKLWHLRGRVRIRNSNGLLYESQELYWDGLKHELYSNVFSKVITPERTLQGTYFRSDERMTHYTVSNSKGSFTTESMEEKEESKNPADTAQQQVEPILRPQTTKRPKTK